MPTLIVHNKRKDVNFHMLINPPKSRAKKNLGEKLVKMIVEKGLVEHGCFKGYFYCIHEKGKFFIHPAMQPEENW